MKKFHVAWWAYSFPLTLLALAAIEYAEEVKGGLAHTLMIVLSALSIVVFVVLTVITAVHSNMLLPDAKTRHSRTTTNKSSTTRKSTRRCDST